MYSNIVLSKVSIYVSKKQENGSKFHVHFYHINRRTYRVDAGLRMQSVFAVTYSDDLLGFRVVASTTVLPKVCKTCTAVLTFAAQTRRQKKK